MSMENHDPVTKILRALRFGLRHFIFRRYTAKFGKGTDLDKMERVLFRKLNDKKTALATLDIQAWLKLMNKNWETVFREKLDYTARGHVNELEDIRNQDSHENDVNTFTDKEAHHIATTAIKLLEAIDKSEPSGDTNAKKQISIIQEIEVELGRLIYGGGEQKTTEKSTSANNPSQPPADSLNGKRHQAGGAVAKQLKKKKEKVDGPSKTAPASNKEAVQESTPPQPRKPRTRPSKRTSHADDTLQRLIRQNQRVIRFAIAIIVIIIVIAFALIVIASLTTDECDPEILGQRYSHINHALARSGCFLLELANPR